MLPRIAGRFFGAQSFSDEEAGSGGGGGSAGQDHDHRAADETQRLTGGGSNNNGPRRRIRGAATTSSPPSSTSSPSAGVGPSDISSFSSPLSSPRQRGGSMAIDNSSSLYGSMMQQEPHDTEVLGNPSDEGEEGGPILMPDDEDDDESDQQDDDVAAATPGHDEEGIAILTRRLRCLFNVITCPIVPLGSLVTLTLIWLLYAAFWVELWQPCSHALHGFAVLSLVLIIYIPNHAKVRSALFDYRRDRDGYQRPASVRRYDQVFHTLALLYVYGGVTLVQTCREDLGSGQGGATTGGGAAGPVLSTCAVTCPHTYRALWVYVSVVELFTFSLILPLLFLPCLYLWYLRQATADAEALAMLQERLQEEDFLFRNGGVTADEVLGQLEHVKLVRVVAEENDGSPVNDAMASPRLFVVPWSGRDLTQAKDASGTKSCCICMSDFEIQVVEATPDEVEAGQVRIPESDEEAVQGGIENADDEAIVRTKNCGHLFHRQCIGSWVGGRWQSSDADNNGESSSPRRRARRTTCPLCRSDLRPST